MLKNIFRNRRRSKNEPFGDENEADTHSGSQQTMTFFPNSATDTQHEERDLSCHRVKGRQRNLRTDNTFSATDVRFKHTDTDYVNKAVPSSQVTVHDGKYKTGHSVEKRHRLSSVVNKILMTHSESKPAPRTRRVVASDLYTRELSTKDRSYKNGGIQDSGTHHNEDTDKDGVFVVPYVCQSCTSSAVHGDTSKNRFMSDNSWICSQCRMQLPKARDRHRSTVSSPAALSAPSIESLDADNSELLSQPRSKLSSRDSQQDGNRNENYDHGSNCKKATHSNMRNKGNYLINSVIDCDSSTSCDRDASNLPSPLHVCDLVCHDSKLSDDDDDVIPELVEIYSKSLSSSQSPPGNAAHYKQHSSPVLHPTVEAEGRSVNESEMYILTDSFLDYSSTSFVHSAAVLDSSQSTTAGHRPPEVMVADDYEVMYTAETNYDNNYYVDSAAERVPLTVASPQFTTNAKKLYPRPDKEAETPPALCYSSDEQMWCRKLLSDWSSDDVLHWVVNVGLVQFYDTFRSKLLRT